MNWGFSRGGGSAESGSEAGQDTEQAQTPDQVYDALLNRNDVLAFQTRKLPDSDKHSNRRASESFDEDTSTALICNKLLHEYSQNKSLVAQNRIKNGEMGVMSEIKSQVELAKESFKYASLKGRAPESLSEQEFNNIQAIDFLDRAAHNIPDARTAQRFVQDYDQRHAAGTK